MIFHTKGAIDGGATIPELVEYLLASYVYNGNYALITGLKSLEYALSLQPNTIIPEETTEFLLLQIMDLMEGESTDFIQKSVELIRTENRDTLDQYLLSEGIVSAKLKHPLVASIYMTELDGELAKTWMDSARELGATEEELAETGLICLLTGGIPAWFEASDSLEDK